MNLLLAILLDDLLPIFVVASVGFLLARSRGIDIRKHGSGNIGATNVGRVLGPQGKMPTPKAGTVTPNIADAVKEFTAGRIEFRNDDGGNVHLPVGRANFPEGDLKANIEAVIEHFKRIKPASSKGQYFKKVSLSGGEHRVGALERAGPRVRDLTGSP